MQRQNRILFWIFFVGYMLLFNSLNSNLEARSITPEQPAIPMSQIDSEKFIFTVGSNEIITIAPNLTVPLEHQGEIGNLFAIALHNNWAVLMDKSGWKPYIGEITMYGKTTLTNLVQPFIVDINRLIKTGESIDFFYGYEIEDTVFLGNAVHFQKSKNNKLKENIFKIVQPSNSLKNLTPEKLPLNLIADNCGTVSPSLEISDIDVGNKAQIFAAVFVENYIIVKTQFGWEFYDGGELKTFKNIVLKKEIQEFDVPIPDGYYGEVFYYYAYLLNRKTMVGNGMRVNVVDD